jgi:SOS-response transcriptional repressor LexA
MATNRPIKFVASGFSSPADDFAQQALDLNKFLVKHPASTFFMRNQTNANQKYGILEGDILIIDRSLKPSSNRLNLIISDDEFKVTDEDGLSKLLKERNSDSEFWGVIISIIRKF